MATISSPAKAAVTPATHRLGTLLVALQFTLIAALARLGVPLLPFQQWNSSMAFLLIGLGALTGLAALMANPPGNFSIHPAPRPGARLVTRGIYRWVRHPMYTAVLIMGLGVSWAANSWCSRIIWLTLLAVLVRKAWMEEDWMIGAHPDYAGYRDRTARFLPGMY